MKPLEITKIVSLIIISASIFIYCYGYYSKIQHLIHSASVNEEHDYLLVQLGEMRRDQYLIDKKTGRNWINICAGEIKGFDCDGSLIWEERMVVGLNGYTQENYMSYLQYLSQTKKNEEKKPK